MTETAPRTDRTRYPQLPRCEKTGKIGFPTRHWARYELKQCEDAHRTGQLNRLERAVYLCPTCQCWHLTSRSFTPLAPDDLPPLVERLKARWNR